MAASGAVTKDVVQHQQAAREAVGRDHHRGDDNDDQEEEVEVVISEEQQKICAVEEATQMPNSDPSILTTSNPSEQPAPCDVMTRSASSTTQQPSEGVESKKNRPSNSPSPDPSLKVDGSVENDARMKTYDTLINQLMEYGEFQLRSKKKSSKSLPMPPHKSFLSFSVLERILTQIKGVFSNEEMLMKIDAPINIVGDLHGQFKDLVNIINCAGPPPKKKYLFLGDYVDRGMHSIETFILLCLFKLRFPDNMFMLRGNHECGVITKIYGFYDECKRKYNVRMHRMFVDAFNNMPVAAIVSQKIFCAHGGISKELAELDSINRISRPTGVPDAGLMCDLLWSDPDPNVSNFFENDRGVSYVFGYDQIRKFICQFDFDLIVRAHQVEETGFAFHCDQKLLTIFSAPNYCGEYDNNAAILVVGEDLTCAIHVMQNSISKRIPNIMKNCSRRGG